MSPNVPPGAKLRVNALVLSIALGLAACGGGGGGDGGGAGGAPGPVPAAIVTQPAPQSADAGANATFTVNATGTGLTYQWKRDGKDIPGATAASYTLADVEPADEGSVFTVEVKNSLGTAVSSGAALRVTTPKGLSMLAGRLGGPGNLDGKDARFARVTGIAVGPSGSLLVSESAGSSGRLRSVDPATGVAATLMAYPKESIGYLMEVDAAGNRYEMTGWAIYKTTPSGVRTLLAGSDQQTHDVIDGAGAKARFSNVFDMTIDGAGNLYITDMHSVRKIDPAGNVSTLAGGGHGMQVVDGKGRNASFRWPGRLAADRAGNLFVIDRGYPNAPTLLRKVTPDGTVTTLALKADDATGAIDSFGDYGGAIAIDEAGNMYVTDTHVTNLQRGCRVLRVTPSGAVTTLAGSATAYGNVDGKGEAARFCGEMGGPLESMTIDKSGNLYLYDAGNYTLRRVTPAGEVTTVAGRAPTLASDDGKGRSASFAASRPVVRVPDTYKSFLPLYTLAADAQGNVFVGQNDSIRKVTASGSVTTLAKATGLQAGSYSYYYPGSVADGGNALVISNNVISRVDANGTLRFVAGQSTVDKGAVDGTGAGASFGAPYGLVVDGLGNIYLHDVQYVNGVPWYGRVVQRKISPEGVVTTLPALASESVIVAWHADKKGGVWAAGLDGAVTRIGADGTRKVVVPAGKRYPTAIAPDAAGNLYMATMNSASPVDERGSWVKVLKFAPDGTETVIAGTEGSYGVRLGAPGSLSWVYALAPGPDGVLYAVTENAVLKLKQ